MGFFKNESGATAIEYGLIAALISVVAISVTQCTANPTPNTSIYAANQTNQKLSFVLAIRNNKNDPLRLNGYFSINPGKSLTFKPSEETWIYFSLPQTAVVMSVNKFKSAELSKAITPLKLGRAKSKRMCIVEEVLDKLLVSEACAKTDSKAVNFYSINGETELYIINR